MLWDSNSGWFGSFRRLWNSKKGWFRIFTNAMGFEPVLVWVFFLSDHPQATKQENQIEGTPSAKQENQIEGTPSASKKI